MVASAGHDGGGTSTRLPEWVTGAPRLGSSVVRAAREGAQAVLSPRGVAGVAVEAAWCTTHLAVYPFGLLRERAPRPAGYGTSHLGPVQRGLLVRDVEAAGTPIVLVHGMLDNRSVFTMLRRGLRRRGFGDVTSLSYSPATNDVRSAARLLAAQVEAVVARSGYERIHVVAHSLGGIIARYYVQRLGGDERVDTLVTMGSPHAGTRAAHLLPTELARQLRPGSELLAELAAPAPGCRTRFVSYWSDLDQLMVPVTAARLDHPDLGATNHLVHGVGHMSLPIQGRLVHEISTALAHLHHDGTTSSTGVSTLPRDDGRPRRQGRGSAGGPATV